MPTTASVAHRGVDQGDAGAELEPTTIRTRYTNARTVIRAAVRDRIMACDVASQIKLPRTRKASAAMSIPTPEQVGNALRTSDGWFAADITACLFAGLRRAGASALQVGDIDFLRRELRVVRQVQWTDDGRMEIRGPKYGSERKVYIPDQLVTMLSEQRPPVPAGQ
jgi:integrase